MTTALIDDYIKQVEFTTVMQLHHIYTLSVVLKGGIPKTFDEFYMYWKATFIIEFYLHGPKHDNRV